MVFALPRPLSKLLLERERESQNPGLNQPTFVIGAPKGAQIKFKMPPLPEINHLSSSHQLQSRWDLDLLKGEKGAEVNEASDTITLLTCTRARAVQGVVARANSGGPPRHGRVGGRRRVHPGRWRQGGRIANQNKGRQTQTH